MKIEYLMVLYVFLACGKYTKYPKEKHIQQIEFDQKQIDTHEFTDSCEKEYKQQCAAVEADIRRLQDLLRDYLTKHDEQNSQKTALDLSICEEQLQLYRGDKGPGTTEWSALDKKYELLRRIFLGRKTDAPIKTPALQNFRPYSRAELISNNKIYETYGPLFISPSIQAADGKIIPSSVEAKGERPWTGYWYPSQKDTMFGNSNSTLQKYDHFLSELGRPAGATAIEQEKYSPLAAEWAGLCDAWSLAAIAEPEPKHAVKRGEITFEVSDIKALLTKKFEGFEPIIYGSRYNGTADTDGEIDDIRPEAMHQLVIGTIGLEGHSLVVDDDPGFEVWNKPLYSMRWTIVQDPAEASAYIIKAWPKMIRNRSEITENLTDVYDVKAPVWEYRLYVDRSQLGPDRKSYKVIYGEWLNKSRDIHPDMALYLPKNPRVHPRNKVIDDSIDLIDQLAAAAQ